jgi:hypothetical protein
MRPTRRDSANIGGGYRALAIGIVLMNLAMIVVALRLTQNRT